MVLLGIDEEPPFIVNLDAIFPQLLPQVVGFGVEGEADWEVIRGFGDGETIDARGITHTRSRCTHARTPTPTHSEEYLSPNLFAGGPRPGLSATTRHQLPPPWREIGDVRGRAGTEGGGIDLREVNRWRRRAGTEGGGIDYRR